MFSLQTSSLRAGWKTRAERSRLRRNISVLAYIVGHLCWSCCVWWEREREQSARCLGNTAALTCSSWQRWNREFYTVWDTNWHPELSLFPCYNLIKTLPEGQTSAGWRLTERQGLNFRSRRMFGPSLWWTKQWLLLFKYFLLWSLHFTFLKQKFKRYWERF